MDRFAQSQADKELIRSRVRLDELARDLGGCELQTRGPDDLWACCPFHAEDTPSFHVRPGRGLFKCFGCGESGDVFSFVQKARGMEFREALEFLADRCGVTLGSLTPEERRLHTEARRLRDTLSAAGKVFRQILRAETDSVAWRYMRERGFTAETLEQFDIGLVPTDLAARLRGSVSSAEIDRAGFTRAFGGRLSFGIRDAHGGLVGFGARTLVDGERPKYVNTRETSAFNKRALLYGLDKAARTITRSRRVVVMEGYTDVMMAHQQGVSEAVATMGTSLTKEHVAALRGRARDLVLLFDGDRAGRDAADRAVRLALTEGLECRVLVLPDGADPGEWFAGRTSDDFQALLDQEGVSTVEFLCQRGLSDIDPRQPGGREQVARDVLELTRAIVDPMRRTSIATEIARACGVDRNLVQRVDAQAAAAPGPAVRRPAPARRQVRWEVSYQFVVLGALASREGVREDLESLDQCDALVHEGARRLWEIGRDLPGETIDPLSWMEQVREHEPRLLASLERVLFPPPDAVLPRYEEALAALLESRRSELEKEARQMALSQPEIHADDAALRALDSSLRTSGAQRAISTAFQEPEPTSAMTSDDTSEPTRAAAASDQGTTKELP